MLSGCKNSIYLPAHYKYWWQLINKKPSIKYTGLLQLAQCFRIMKGIPENNSQMEQIYLKALASLDNCINGSAICLDFIYPVATFYINFYYFYRVYATSSMTEPFVIAESETKWK